MTYELRKMYESLPDENELYNSSIQAVMEAWGLDKKDMEWYKKPQIKTSVEFGKASYMPRSNVINFNPERLPQVEMTEEVFHAIHT